MTGSRDTQRRRAAAVATSLVAIHGIVVLTGWWVGWDPFVRPSPTFIPMAPSTALAFLVLSLALLIQLSRPRAAPLRYLATLIPWTVATTAVLNLAVPAGLDRWLGGATGAFGPVVLGVMSPVTAAALVPLALAIAASGARLRYAGVLATLAAIVGATVALGYAYGTPLLYGSATIPVALPTGLSLLVLGIATVLQAGPRVWPVEPLLGESPRARLLRAFLPATIGLIVFVGFLDARFADLLGPDRVLIAAWFALASVGLVTFIVSRISNRIAGELDRAYAERHRAEQRYREMFEQTLAGVATTRLTDGRILLCNEAFARAFGYDSATELTGGQARALYWDPSDRERVLAALQPTGQLRNFELQMRRKDGKPVWVISNLTLYHAEGGEARIENTVIDVSERKSLEQQLWQAQKLDALGSLAGGVAHDFNNLLTAIIGYADLMRDEMTPDDPRLEDLKEITKACDRATALTRQLLVFSRRQPFEPTSVRLDQRVQDMEKMLRRLLGPTITLVTASDADLATIMADRSQLEQVVLNLAVNSRDAMPDGGTLTIETRNVQVDEPLAIGQHDMPPGDYVMLAVSDTGTGMSQETLGRVFEPFFTTKERGKGTGLGLSTVYGIVKQSRGYIQVYSELGIGTTFKCYFPLSHVAVPAPAPVPEAAQGRGTETILVVEDEAPIRALVVNALQRLGYTVLAAADGAGAMALATSHDGSIHLLLSDGVLSGVRVPDLLRRLREHRPETKVLLMSGYSQEAVFQHDLVAASTAFLAKPFTTRQLAQRVREVLDAGAA
ncbi:MAG: ATP-binding protein [Gemmatimonadales bacterium]